VRNAKGDADMACRYCLDYMQLLPTTANDGRCFCSSLDVMLCSFHFWIQLYPHSRLQSLSTITRFGCSCSALYYLAIFGMDYPVVISRTFKGN